MFANKSVQKTLIFISGAAFLGLMTLPLINVLRGSEQQSAQIPQQETETPISLEQLQETEKGYEKVLQREPNNPAALQGLVETRLQMNNLEGMIEPIEKLIELYPQEEQLQTLLAAIKQQVDQPSEVPLEGVGSQESGVGSQESGVRSQPFDKLRDQSEVRSQESGVSPSTSSGTSQKSGVGSQESGARSQE